ncbi:MAG: 50S ribosomal protein L21 [Dehalococcoidia bacterium]
MYAIVRTGGKQYRVEEGRTLTVEKLPAEEGSQVELDHVLMIADDGEVTVGTPTIDGARVVANVEGHGRAKKIIVFKYKSKVRTRKKTGHRQHFTRLAVQEILRPGQESKIKKPRARRRAKAEDEPTEAPAAEAVVAPPVAEAPVAAPAAEAPAEAPKRRTRRAAAEPKAPARKPRTRKAPEAEGEAPGDATKRRTRKKADEPEASAEEKKPPTRRRTTPKKTDEE